MRVNDLITLLETRQISNPEIRIGDQLEAGPYDHVSVGGVWLGAKGELILCGNPDDEWEAEEATDVELPVLWKPIET